MDADLHDLELMDQRIDFVAPTDFRVAQVAQEVIRLRADAEWAQLELGGRPAEHGTLPSQLHPNVVTALERTNRLPLYTHQSEAISSALNGEHVVQATTTGSGKSLGFIAPVLDRLVRTSISTAILMFPLRALANDQLTNLASLSVHEDPWVDETSIDIILDPEAEPIRVSRYDGSTPEHHKIAIRKNCRLLITTPDMIHASLLRMATRKYKDGTTWTRFLSGLAYVVIDEIHTYQGMFGSNVAQVLRRLRRAADLYGASPVFLAASATIGNPTQLAEQLTGVDPFRTIDRDGSPQRERTVLICNPPLSEAGAATAPASEDGAQPTTDGSRIAPQTVAIDLMAGGALASPDHPPVRTVCFTRSRLEVFAMTQRLRNRLQQLGRSDLSDAVAPYAATMLTDDRLEAEAKLKDGSTLAIVSTNALELGIDIPELSIAVLSGYPGQISSFRQRAGRAGRAGEGLVILIVGDDPLQQYVAHNPATLEALLAGRPEDVVINPDEPEVVRRYGLAPGQAELGGIAYEDAEYFGKVPVAEWLAAATGAPSAVHDGTPMWTVLWDADEYAGLRSASNAEPYTVLRVVKRDKTPIGVIDSSTAPRDAFVGAIWNTPRDTYRVVGFDTKKHEIYCEGPVTTTYLTRGVPVDTVSVGQSLAPPRSVAAGVAGYSLLTITRNVFSYKRLHLSGSEEAHPVESPKWPPVEFETEGMRLEVSPSAVVGLESATEAVRGLEHILLSISPIVVACDPFDLDGTSDGLSVYIYDSFGAGLGLSRVVYERLDEVLEHALKLISECPCPDGCPGCIVLSRRPDQNRNLSKAGTRHILEHLA